MLWCFFYFRQNHISRTFISAEIKKIVLAFLWRGNSFYRRKFIKYSLNLRIRWFMIISTKVQVFPNKVLALQIVFLVTAVIPFDPSFLVGICLYLISRVADWLKNMENSRLFFCSGIRMDFLCKMWKRYFAFSALKKCAKTWSVILSQISFKFTTCFIE